MRGGGRSQRSKPARRRQLNGSVLFRQSPSSLVITAIRGFQVQLQAHLFVRLCVGFVWVCSCLCHTAVQILVSPHNYTLKEEWNLHFTLKYHCVVWRTNKAVTVRHFFFLPKRIPGDFSFAADAVSVHFYMTSIGFSFLKRKKKTKQKKLLVSWEFLMSSGKFCWK